MDIEKMLRPPAVRPKNARVVTSAPDPVKQVAPEGSPDQALLDYLTAPRTAAEVADHFDRHVSGVRLRLKRLARRGRIGLRNGQRGVEWFLLPPK